MILSELFPNLCSSPSSSVVVAAAAAAATVPITRSVSTGLPRSYPASVSSPATTLHDMSASTHSSLFEDFENNPFLSTEARLAGLKKRALQDSLATHLNSTSTFLNDHSTTTTSTADNIDIAITTNNTQSDTITLNEYAGLFGHDNLPEASASASSTMTKTAAAPAATELFIANYLNADEAFDHFNLDWAEDGLNAIPWLPVPTNEKMKVALTAPLPDATPELSPSTSLCTPTADMVNSPLGFDTLGLDEVSQSPCLGWPSLEDSFSNCGNSSQDLAGLSFDCVAPPMTWLADDFVLFPSEKSVPSSTLVPTEEAATPSVSPASSLLDQVTVGASPIAVSSQVPSPAESELAALLASPTTDLMGPTENYAETFGIAKVLGQDVITPFDRVAPRKPTQSPTKPGFQTAKRRRRRRITSEEASRFIPDEQKGDPDAKARYLCSLCGKTFSRPFNLRSHRATHTGEKPFPCSHKNEQGVRCHWAFARRHDLDRHIRSRHAPTKQYKCKTCGATCGRTDAFKRHLQRNAICGEENDVAFFDDDEDQDMDQVSHL